MKWFNNFENKERFSFMVSDIESFHPSISENLFIKAIQFAKQMTEIIDGDINLTIQDNEGMPWVKKEGNEGFVVPTGCFVGAEVCELVGSHIL